MMAASLALTAIVVVLQANVQQCTWSMYRADVLGSCPGSAVCHPSCTTSDNNGPYVNVTADTTEGNSLHGGRLLLRLRALNGTLVDLSPTAHQLTASNENEEPASTLQGFTKRVTMPLQPGLPLFPSLPYYAVQDEGGRQVSEDERVLVMECQEGVHPANQKYCGIYVADGAFEQQQQNERMSTYAKYPPSPPTPLSSIHFQFSSTFYWGWGGGELENYTDGGTASPECTKYKVHPFCRCLYLCLCLCLCLFLCLSVVALYFNPRCS